MSDYRFERLSESNLTDLIYLYKHSFNVSTDIDFLKKKYATQKFGTAYLGHLAYSSRNEPAAYYGVFPIKVQYKGKEVLAAQSGDTMTHPKHQGKGLFIRLAKMTYELSKELGVEFIFGFPNQNSYGGFMRKLDWKHYANVNNYKIKTGALPFEKLAKKFRFFQPIYSSLFLSQLNRIETKKIFENSLSQQLNEYGNVIHNSSFFEYKTYYRSFLITINGKGCLVKVDGRMWVGDIEYCDKDTFREILKSIKVLAKKTGCSTIQFSVFENSHYDQWLKEEYAVELQNPVGCLDLNGNFDPGKFAYQAVDFDTF